MKSFFALFSVLFKNRFFSRSFLSVCLVTLILISSFALLCPAAASPSAKVGIIFDNSDQRLCQSCYNLLNLQEIDFIRYDNEQLLRRDVMSGELHCGYKLNYNSETPITVYETAGSILTPVLDELVFSAWFEAHMLNTAPDLYGSGYHDLIAAEIERLSLENRPLAVDVTVNMSASGGEYEAASLYPMIYAVFIPLLLLSAVFCAQLCPQAEKDTSALLLINSTCRHKILLAHFLSQLACFLIITLTFELLFKLFSIENSFVPMARIVFSLLMSAAAAVVFSLFSKIRPNSYVLFCGIVWAAVSIVFSGAFISPALLGAFEPIKYLSPSWLLLRLMTDITVL